MVAPDLYLILKGLFEAGARDVPGSELPWKARDAPTILYALNMLYMTRLQTEDGTYFSLTPAGYRAIGKEAPAPASIMGLLRSMFRRLR